MAKNSVRPETPRPPNGNEIHNLILNSLPKNEYSKIIPAMEFVRLKLHQVLHDAGDVIKSTYFMESGLASVLAVQPDGKSVEVGLIGKEGFAGLPVIVGLKTSALRIVTQADGAAHRLEVDALKTLMSECPKFTSNFMYFL